MDLFGAIKLLVNAKISLLKAKGRMRREVEEGKRLDKKTEMLLQKYPMDREVIEIEFIQFKGAPITASILGQAYRGYIVQADSKAECLKELSISMKVMEEFKANLKKEIKP